MNKDAITTKNLGSKKILGLTGCQLLFLVLWMQHTVFYVLRIFLAQLPLIVYIVRYIFPLVLILTIIFAIENIIQQIKLLDVIILVAGVAFWFISGAAHPEYDIYFSTYWDECLSAFLMFFVGKLAIQSGDFEVLYSRLYLASIAGVILTFAYFALLFVRSGGLEEEYMDTAYKSLPSVLMIVAVAFAKPKGSRALLAVLAIGLLLVLGTRGPLIISLLFVVVCFVIYVKNSGARFVVGTVSILLVLAEILFGFFEKILMSLKGLLKSFGVSTRIVESLLESDFFESTGRDALVEIIMKKADQSFWGYGIFSDRYFTTGLWGSIDEGIYAHNIYAEFCIDFGVFMGTLLIVMIVIALVFKIGSRQVSKDLRIMLWIFICSGLLKLFVSGSWLVEPHFFMLLGILAAQSKNHCE